MGRRQPSKLVVGAWVRIARPAFFVRCGYPMTVGGEAGRIETERWPDIDAFLRLMGCDTYLHETPRAVHEIAKAVAYLLCKQKRFGGTARTIHTRDVPEAAGRECEILSVRFVKTGTYERGGVSCGYYGDGEPEPNYLGDEVTHRLLKTSLTVDTFDLGDGWRDFGTHSLEIEAANVELVEPAPARVGEVVAR
jgi:hypothetical protein